MELGPGIPGRGVPFDHCDQENLASALAGEAAQMVMARNWLDDWRSWQARPQEFRGKHLACHSVLDGGTAAVQLHFFKLCHVNIEIYIYIYIYIYMHAHLHVQRMRHACVKFLKV